jgi:hypothetical protein
VFERLVLRGTAGSILRGYLPAARVRAWRIYHHRPDLKHDARWTLTATIEAVDKFQLRQRPLMFTAARLGGFWSWPLNAASIQIGETTLTATLGPPEH